MEKILVITYYWPPSGGVGVQRILKFVKYLPEFNIMPVVVTVREDKASYPSYDENLNKDVPAQIEVFRTNTLEPFEIYSKLLGKKSIPTGFSNEANPTGFQKFSRFIRGNLFIPDARKGWNRFAYDVSKKIIERQGIKTVLTTSPPHSTQLIGLKLKKEYGVKWIADLRDPWTDIHYYKEFRHLSFRKKVDLEYEREVLENADRIITVSNEFGKLFAGKSKKIDPKKIYTITNGYDDDDFNNNKESKPSRDKFIITVTGTMPENYNPFTFIDAFAKVVEKNKDVNFTFRMVGNAASSVIDYMKRKGLEKNIDLIPTVPHEKAVEYLYASTALFLVIPQFKSEKGLIPAKLFEYLAVRKPIICLGPLDNEAVSIINECKAGKVFERNNEADLAEYIQSLVNDWKQEKDIEIKNDCYKNYSRYNQTKKLSQIVKS